MSSLKSGNGSTEREDVSILSEPNNTEGRKLQWLVYEQLGTARMIFDTSGRLHDDPTTPTIKEGVRRHDYLPFGEENSAGTTRTQANGYINDGVRQKFTGHERDTETGLDFMQARYCSSTQGRFTSVDPLYYQVSMAIDPQRFNLYAYTRNNPLKWTDPSGENLYLRGNQDWLRTEVLYQTVGGQETFNQYFHIQDGQVLLNDGVDLSNANAGVQELASVVNMTDNYVYFAGADAQAAVNNFDGYNGSDRNGNPTVTPLNDNQRADLRVYLKTITNNKI